MWREREEEGGRQSGRGGEAGRRRPSWLGHPYHLWAFGSTSCCCICQSQPRSELAPAPHRRYPSADPPLVLCLFGFAGQWRWSQRGPGRGRGDQKVWLILGVSTDVRQRGSDFETRNRRLASSQVCGKALSGSFWQRRWIKCKKEKESEYIFGDTTAQWTDGLLKRDNRTWVSSSDLKIQSEGFGQQLWWQTHYPRLNMNDMHDIPNNTHTKALTEL